MSDLQFGDTRLPPSFWNKIVEDSFGCWRWKASKTSGGYARFSANRMTRVAHRYAFEILVGPIDAHLQLDHLCRIRDCVNPSHLEPVSARENTRRGFGPSGNNMRKTHCASGHALSGENLRIMKDGERRCVACQRVMTNRCMNSLRAQRRAIGQCVRCESPAAHDRVACQKHSTQNNARTLRRLARRNGGPT